VVSNTKKRTLIIILLAVLSAIYFLYNPETSGFPGCPLHALTGIYCPGCGSQRAFHSLLHFDLLKTADYNILFIPALFVVIYNEGIRAYNYFGKKNLQNYVYHPSFPKAVLITVIIFWILRNIPIQPFSWLAP